MENMNIDSEAFQKELSSYSDDDLELIIETQKELFSTEEMQMLEQELEKRKQAKQAQIIASLPKEIICPKQRFTRGYKRYKETSGLTEWKPSWGASTRI